MDYNAGSYDIAVIGAGHAGIEAALAAARQQVHAQPRRRAQAQPQHGAAPRPF